MTEAQKRKLVVMISRGIDDERSSVALTIANGGMTAGLEVAIFLTSNGVDLARRGGVAATHVQPLEPLQALVDDFLRRGGKLWACTPCAKARGYEQKDLVEGAVIVGSSAMHEWILEGAATLSF
jgi:predicted peroxiredoxin